MTDEITMRTAVADDWDAIYAMVAAAFNADGDEDASAAERPLFEPDRCLARDPLWADRRLGRDPHPPSRRARRRQCRPVTSA